tara:strand:- start:50 stop:817 length:768 start_codon:yes stop_codon:yes gene_type:complete
MKFEKIRIIPKLEIKNEFLIKGVRFEGLRKIGNPVDFANKYFNDGADQINIIDIVASLYSRDNLYDIVNKITEKVYIPVCVGGGIKSIEHIKALLECGADRVIVNSEVLRNIKFIDQIVQTFGKQFLTVSIEAKKIGNEYYCMMDYGRENSNKTLSEWIRELNKCNVGEVIFNSIDNDGIENGFDLDLLNIVSNEELNCPKVINGGAGNFDNFIDVLKKHEVDGFSIATSLHFNKFSIRELKEFLISKKININPL